MSTLSETTRSSNSSTTSNQTDNAQQPLSKDTIYHLLQVQRRRLVLHYLQGTTDPVVMRDLAEQVAAWEYGTAVDQLASRKRQRTYVSLYQSHLPELDKQGVIKYDQSEGRIERTDIATQLDPYLTTIQEQQVSGLDEEASGLWATLSQRWINVYFGGVLFSCGLLLADLLNLSLTGQLSGRLILSIVVSLFSLITILYQISTIEYQNQRISTEET